VSERARLQGRLAALQGRARIGRAVRAYFEGEGFLEVETPLRVFAPGQELHLDAIPVDGGRHLITSPEYHMKRLLGAGEGFARLFQLGRSFRAHERGAHHEPEFTMLEWYRARAPLDVIAQDCEAIVRAAARAAGTYPRLPVPVARRAPTAPATLDVEGPFDRVTVAALMRRHAGVEVRGDESAPALREAMRRAGHDVGSAEAWDDVFFQVWLDRVEPHLGLVRPTFVTDWPLPLAALARRKPGPEPVAERFELYAGGLELANAFGELTDPVEQRGRFEAELVLRRQRGKTVYPIDERLLEAIGHMPPTSGVAVGFDRLVMLALGAPAIRDVIAFADDET
jgi:lysyl-tRNA synthetase class 2